MNSFRNLIIMNLFQIHFNTFLNFKIVYFEKKIKMYCSHKIIFHHFLCLWGYAITNSVILCPALDSQINFNWSRLNHLIIPSVSPLSLLENAKFVILSGLPNVEITRSWTDHVWSWSLNSFSKSHFIQLNLTDIT